MSISSSDLVAAFLAKGGKVSKITEGTRAIEDEKAIYNAMRAGKRAQADDTVTERNSERLAENAMDASYYGHRVVGIENGEVVTRSDLERTGK